MVEIILDSGEKLELEQESIKYTKQCNDIAELSSRQTNFTDSFSLPKTPNNTRVLDMLGIAGDVSRLPYTKIGATLLDNGLPLITNGWLNIKETTNEYKVNIYDGLIDFFKAIENKNFGEHVDLSEIDHEKNLTTIINSFTNENYRYIINDYGGLTHTNSGNNINIDYLIPAVRLKYLWNKVFSTFGFEYLGNIFFDEDFTGLWLTYPKATPSIETPTLYAELFKNNTQVSFNINNVAFWDLKNIIGGGAVANNWRYVITENAFYKLDFKIRAFSAYERVGSQFPDTINRIINYQIKINGEVVGTYPAVDTLEFSLKLNLSINDVVEVYFTYELSVNDGPRSDYFYKHTRFVGTIANPSYLKISKYNSIDISFTEELKQLSITDFIKDILWRFNLTIFQDIDNKYIFKTFNERLRSDIVDWTSKYMERTSESYSLKDYAQINYFKHNYNDKEGSYNDGKIYINNKNLKERKDILKSNIYSPEKNPVAFKINITEREIVYQTLVWQKEINENSGVTEVRYKELDSRFYFLRSEKINQTATLESTILGVSQSVNSLPIARFNTTTMKDFIGKYYNNIELLFNDFRFHKIKLALNYLDFITLDFDKVYYFKQEANYYILNKVTFENGKPSNAEFYRVKVTETDTLNRHYSSLHYSTEHYD